MKKVLITFLLLCSLFVTGCNDTIFTNTTDNTLVFSAVGIENYNTAYNQGQYVLNKDGTCEYAVTYDWQDVDSFDTFYRDFDAQIRKKTVCYGTYIQNQNEVLITLDEKKHRVTYEVQGIDSDAFKAVYTLNNDNVFDNKVETNEGFTSSTYSTTAITAEIHENTLKLLSVKNYYNGDCMEHTQFDYNNGQIKNIKYQNNTHDIVYSYEYNDDGTYTLTSSYYYNSSNSPERIIIKESDGSAKFTLYDKSGKIYCIIDSENGNTDIEAFKGTMHLYCYNNDNSYTVTVYKNSLLPNSKYISQIEEYNADNILTKTVKYNNGKPISD